MELDLSSLESVRIFAKNFLAKHQRCVCVIGFSPLVGLDGLVNNAGIISSSKATTKDGFELQFGVNHFAHFLLTELLLDVYVVRYPFVISVTALKRALLRAL